MGCDELRHLLNTAWRESDLSTQRIATHIRSCPRCSSGIVCLTKALISNDELSCAQCRSRFPAYYESTRPTYPLVKMPDFELAEMVLHLSICDACQEQYRVFALLSEMEEQEALEWIEQDEMAD